MIEIVLETCYSLFVWFLGEKIADWRSEHLERNRQDLASKAPKAEIPKTDLDQQEIPSNQLILPDLTPKTDQQELAEAVIVENMPPLPPPKKEVNRVAVLFILFMHFLRWW